MDKNKKELHVLVEEPSAEAALGLLIPKIIGARATHRIITFQSKRQLMNNLEQRLRAYRRRLELNPHLRLAVLVDEDRQDCRKLKQELEAMAERAGLATKSRPRANGSFHLITRLAIEELEAWFFGDVDALLSAYDQLPATLRKKAPYRRPDAIKGGTWEALHRVLNRSGYDMPIFPKIEAARRIAAHMDPARNQSRSFQVFCKGIEALL